ncbi:hypothetical protein GCM10027277_07760 [Pseudoduganella ginsengisoli]|uniref:Flagellar biosynthetic protein FliO n=1 Tax=Pseudoduganella ginsengisoli TaxID=1462440 RepID=A0A6L6Q0V8_9BURK|nr:flagellar biosynthetic protein FliO [Pseudoduganella ginsengisoli]MTW03275.1 hypothetical protein [Pseudoduganella ginsengisoli]
MKLTRMMAACLLWLAAQAAAASDTPAPPAASAPPSASASASAAASPIPFKREKHSEDTLAYQSLAALVLAALAAYGIALGLRRLRTGSVALPMQRARRIRVAESVRLGRHHTLHVVEYDGEQLLLSEGQHGVTVVSRKDGATGAAHD